VRLIRILQGAAVLVATHDAQVVRRCDRRLHIVDGAFTIPEILAWPAG
jgi:ABC-type lipoprotein export system ATPase subunit